MPRITDSQLVQIQDSLSIIGERFKSDNTLIFDSKRFADALAEKSAEKSAEKNKLTERHRQILGLMIMDNPYSTEQIANEIKLKGPRTRQLLNELVEFGYLECIGKTKSRRYVRIK